MPAAAGGEELGMRCISSIKHYREGPPASSVLSDEIAQIPSKFLFLCLYRTLHHASAG